MSPTQMQTPVAFDRILLATDFSPSTDVTLGYATGLARQFSSLLEVANVVNISIPMLDVISESTLESLRLSSAERLQRLARKTDGVKTIGKALEGLNPASDILDEAVNVNTSLIVQGSSSKHGLKRFALGSTAEEIIRQAPCPVLTIGPLVTKPADKPLFFHSIVYATDLSKQAKKALDVVFYLAETSGAKVYLCHVINDKESSSKSNSDAASLSSLKAVIPESVYDWCYPECIVEHGNAADAILNLATRVDADLIVLGARKSSFWLNYVNTGLTPALLAAATCPILTVS